MMYSYSTYQKLIENYLNKILLSAYSEPELYPLVESMNYSLLAGGKRLRPVLALEFGRICGISPEDNLPAACALEMLHTYSLIHDDLPCMDNDDLRRGKPTNHIVYGEWNAVLAGDSLQAEAFRLIAGSSYPPSIKAECLLILSKAAGVEGICGGQFMDLSSNGVTLEADTLKLLNERKTGALFRASCMMGAAAAGAPEEKVQAAGDYGSLLGAAFQIRDDMLDALGDEKVFGKPIGSDAKEDKNTFMRIFGESECARMVADYTEKARAVLHEHFDDCDFLCSLSDSLINRVN